MKTNKPSALACGILARLEDLDTGARAPALEAIDAELAPLVDALRTCKAALDGAATMYGQRFTRTVRDACPEWYEVMTCTAAASDGAADALAKIGGAR